jgi:uncharacterized protein (UPF0276 family)
MGFLTSRHDPAAGPVPARAGIGLRFQHHAEVLAETPDVAWLEVHPENYLGGGPTFEILAEIRRDYPLSLHAVGLSLGSAEGLDREHLAQVARLARRLEPGLVSDHLSWSAAGGLHLPDLLPLPYTEEALAVFVRHLDQAQTALGRRILIENPSAYLAFARSTLSEAEFLGEVVRRTGCGLLLDVNNLFVTACNLGHDPAARLAALLDAVPAEAIGEIHLAGHSLRSMGDGRTLRIDDHGSPVRPEVWRLFEKALARLGPRPALIEWDRDVPPLAVLLAEAAAANARLDPASLELRHAYPG